MNLSVNTSIRTPNTSLSSRQLKALETILEEEEEAVRFVLEILRTHTSCEYATFELERIRPLIGKARLSEIVGILERVLFQSLPHTP
jgi:hypothetical protein